MFEPSFTLAASDESFLNFTPDLSLFLSLSLSLSISLADLLKPLAVLQRAVHPDILRVVHSHLLQNGLLHYDDWF